MIVKDNEDDDYLGNQIQNLNINEIIVDRNEIKMKIKAK